MDDMIELSSTKQPSSIPDSPASQAPPAHVQLIQMVSGNWVSSVVYAAAKLDLARQGRLPPHTGDSDQFRGEHRGGGPGLGPWIVTSAP